MAAIFCNGCGNTFDSHVRCCARCQRCPRCGSKNASPDRCGSCGYPADAAQIAQLEKDLDPALPSNSRSIRSLEGSWQRQQLMQRVRLWPTFGLLAPIIVVLTFAAFGLGWLLDIEDRWVSSLPTVACMLLFFLVLPRLLQAGHLRWLLRDEPDSATAFAKTPPPPQ